MAGHARPTQARQPSSSPIVKAPAKAPVLNMAQSKAPIVPASTSTLPRHTNVSRVRQ